MKEHCLVKSGNKIKSFLEKEEILHLLYPSNLLQNAVALWNKHGELQSLQTSGLHLQYQNLSIKASKKVEKT